MQHVCFDLCGMRTIEGPRNAIKPAIEEWKFQHIIMNGYHCFMSEDIKDAIKDMIYHLRFLKMFGILQFDSSVTNNAGKRGAFIRIPLDIFDEHPKNSIDFKRIEGIPRYV